MPDVKIAAPLLCPKCGNHRTRLVGQADQAPVRLRCEGCGQVSVITEETAP